MKNIMTTIKQMEKQYQVKILYACETGSRAWGFPSPDSDFDVRFIYIHKRDWYLNLGERKDTIEIMQGDLDITGWDLRKSLQLLKKSNAALIERFQSPINYYGEEMFKVEFKKLIEIYYSPTAVFYHHYSLANKFWEDMKDAETIKLKAWFYLVRSLLSCLWIIKDNSVLPMHIEGLMVHMDDSMKDRLRGLIALKSTVTEKHMQKRDDELNAWLLGLKGFIESSKDKLVVNNADYKMLNDFFLKTLYENDNNRLG